MSDLSNILTLALENIRLIFPELRLMTTTGFCGAYTTFLTEGLEANHFWVNPGDPQTLFGDLLKILND